MRFLDEAKIFVKSGNGGKGCLSFRREKFIEYGGPDGGNGGRGGDIIIVAANNLNTLIDYRYQQHFKAQNGRPGMGQNRYGKSGNEIILNLPVGTEILDEYKQQVICDLTKEGQTLVLCKGGDGGFGNATFKSSTNQAPRRTTDGWPGEEMWIWLRLKLISDVALLGMPNAGKSTFVSRVSAARPKIADYPFTTLHPQLGVVRVDKVTEFVIADIPGLIEGAHQGSGLGDKFLKHLERSKLLLHLIDVNEDVVENYKKIRHELKLFSNNLANKKEIIALNKIDSVDQQFIDFQMQQLAEYCGHQNICAISAATGNNISKVLYQIKEELFED